MNILSLLKPLRKTSFLILTLGLLCACSGCGRKKIDTGQWYDYGNGLVNLDEVSLLSGKCEIHVLGENILEFSRVVEAPLERTQVDGCIEKLEGILASEKLPEKFIVTIECTIDFHPVFELQLSDEEYNQDSYEDIFDDLEDALETYEDLVAQLNAIRY